MSPSFPTAVEKIARRDGVGPVRTGIVVTAVFTGILFLIPFVAPLGSIKRTMFDATSNWWMGNPLKNLRLLGGVFGGFVAGYLTHLSDTRSALTGIQGAVNGIKAAVLGLAALYLTYVVVHLSYATFVLGQVPPPVYLIVVVPLVFGLPLAGMHLLGGLLGGFAGNMAGALMEG